MEILNDGTDVYKNHSNALIKWYVIKRDDNLPVQTILQDPQLCRPSLD